MEVRLGVTLRCMPRDSPAEEFGDTKCTHSLSRSADSIQPIGFAV